MRGGDDAHARFLRRVPADAVILAVRQHAQQTHLQIGRHVADLVQEQRPALGLLEAPAAQALRAGERAALMAEELRLEQVLGNRRRVDRDERPGHPRAVAMKRARDEFLAGTGLAGDEHGRTRLRQAADGAKHFLHRRRLAEHFRRFGPGRGDCQPRRPLGRRAADKRQRVVDVERLRQILERAALKRGDRTVQVRVRGHDDHRHLRIALLHLVQEHEAGLAGHSDIGNEHLRLTDGERLQHLVRRRESLERNTLARQRFFEHPANRAVIVDDPYRFRTVAARWLVVVRVHLFAHFSLRVSTPRVTSRAATES